VVIIWSFVAPDTENSYASFNQDRVTGIRIVEILTNKNNYNNTNKLHVIQHTFRNVAKKRANDFQFHVGCCTSGKGLTLMVSMQ